MEVTATNSYDFGFYTKESRNTAQEASQKKETQSTQNSSQKQNKQPNELTPAEKQQVAKLQATDTEVRAHEAAHQAGGGGLAGGASFSYTRGPDNKMYAVAGEVPISMEEGSSPQETIANARKVQAAAMAPANPSPQDYSVASSARVMEMKAQQQLAKEQQQELQKPQQIATYQENQVA